MSLLHRRFLAAAALLIVVGLAVAGIGYSMTRNQEGDTNMEKQSYAAADVNAIQIGTDVPHVIITPVDGDQMNLSWQTDEYMQYEATLKNGVLEISYRNTRNWLESIFNVPFVGNEYILEIELPKAFQGDLMVDTASGKIIAETAADLKECKLKTVSGVISAANLTVQSDLSLHTTSGSITAENLQAMESVRLQSVSGSITAQAVTAGGKLNGKTTSGRLEFTQVTAEGDMTLNSVSGSLNLQDVSCAALSAKSVSGSIRPVGLKADSIELRSTSGAVKGMLAGSQSDYSISVSTVSGSNNLKNADGNGAKPLQINTVSGSVKITFEEGN